MTIILVNGDKYESIFSIDIRSEKDYKIYAIKFVFKNEVFHDEIFSFEIDKILN